MDSYHDLDRGAVVQSQRLPPPKFALTVAVFAGLIAVIELIWVVGSASWFKWTFVAIFAAATVCAGTTYWFAVRAYRRR